MSAYLFFLSLVYLKRYISKVIPDYQIEMPIQTRYHLLFYSLFSGSWKDLYFFIEK
jgi:hypothetical protein